MTIIEILGVADSIEMNMLRANVVKALEALRLKAVLESVTEVERLMNYRINGIPALVVNGSVVLQKHVPSVEDLKILLKVFTQNAAKKFTMKEILVPTDFSEVAENAFNFALDLTEVQKGRVKAVYVYHPEFDPQNPYLTEPTFMIVDHAKERLKGFIDKFDQKMKDSTVEVEINGEVLIGFPVEEIIRQSVKDSTDMIIMGTTGEKSFLGKLFGSVSTNVAQKAKCPVMLVPPSVQFRGFKHIMYACDYESASESMLNKLVDMAEVFGADIHFVHVAEDAGNGDYKEIENRLFNVLFKGKEPSFSFTMTEVKGHSVVDGLNDYATLHKIDMVVLVCPQRQFWENLFHKSVTKAMALNTKLPILVLHN
jgi:nucleotide-binding universal stress UspA family protein